MTLQKQQEAERHQLIKLCDRMERKGSDIDNLISALHDYKTLFDSDPTPHITASLRHYLQMNSAEESGLPQINRQKSTSKINLRNDDETA